MRAADLLMTALYLAVGLLGLWLTGMAFGSAIRTFVVPRAERDAFTRFIFRRMWNILVLFIPRHSTYQQRDRVSAYYAPVTLVLLPVFYLLALDLGFAAIYWALAAGALTPYEALLKSLSTLLTLGFAPVNGWIELAMAFLEATLGLILIAILIAYIPTMYNAFSMREKAVNMLEVRAGAPPTAREMLMRFGRLGRPDSFLTQLWHDWEDWFAAVAESHTSLVALVFFRSPRPMQHWVNAAGAVLDAAAFRQAALDRPPDVQASLCIRAGYLMLREICDFFGVSYNHNPSSEDPISVTRAQFESVLDDLAASGLAVKADRDQAWRDWRGWRVNYDTVLLALAEITWAPPADWNGQPRDEG